MNESGLYKAFNARWLSPEDVARKFVPIPQFSALLGQDNCVLAGPRGCGKTTLLKMLTRRAQNVWEQERTSSYDGALPIKPSFEAIYVPSDVRWSYELRAIASDVKDQSLGELCQRILVGSNALNCAIELFQRRLASAGDDSSDSEYHLARAIIDNFGFQQRVPTLQECSQALRRLSSDVRGLINLKDFGRLNDLVSSVSPRLYSDAVDPIINACKIYNELVDERIRVMRWGICFDEVEIAPTWFGRELFSSLRSLSEQEFLLKFTWSPILPGEDEGGAQEANDYDPIKLWSAHVLDPKEFCEALTGNFLKAKFPDSNYKAENLLGASVFASEGADEEPSAIYQKGSILHRAMLELAEKDQQFAMFVESKRILLNEGFVVEGEKGNVMDKIFRKMKPIVLMRNEFSKGEERRTRKRVTLYAGKEAVFGMSEGNPRRLLGLLNELFDIFQYRQGVGSVLEGPIEDLVQAKVLAKASLRALTSLKSTPVFPGEPDRPVKFSLFEVINRIGEYLRDRFYEGDFQLDPVGSFRIDEGLEPDLVHALKRLVDTGAIVPISEVPGELPSGLVNNRYRLSFMIAPRYKLAFRNYKETKLSSILGDHGIDGQLEFDILSR